MRSAWDGRTGCHKCFPEGGLNLPKWTCTWCCGEIDTVHFLKDASGLHVLSSFWAHKIRMALGAKFNTSSVWCAEFPRQGDSTAASGDRLLCAVAHQSVHPKRDMGAAL